MSDKQKMEKLLLEFALFRQLKKAAINGSMPILKLAEDPNPTVDGSKVDSYVVNVLPGLVSALATWYLFNEYSPLERATATALGGLAGHYGWRNIGGWEGFTNLLGNNALTEMRIENPFGAPIEMKKLLPVAIPLALLALLASGAHRKYL